MDWALFALFVAFTLVEDIAGFRRDGGIRRLRGCPRPLADRLRFRTLAGGRPDGFGHLLHDPLRSTSQNLGIQGWGGLGLSTLARHLGMLVIVLRVARRAPGLLYVRTHHSHHRVVREPPLARTVIVQNVTKPKLALLHQKLPKEPRWRG
jgi:hypothetical protein